MTKVYLLTKGSYSDYRVMGVFSSPEKWEIADTIYSQLTFSDHNEIEEYELDELADNTPIFSVTMDKDGQVSKAEVELPAYVPDEQVSIFVTYDGRALLLTFVETDDKERAIKVANERRAFLIASGEWDKQEQQERKKRGK